MHHLLFRGNILIWLLNKGMDKNETKLNPINKKTTAGQLRMLTEQQWSTNQ